MKLSKDEVSSFFELQNIPWKTFPNLDDPIFWRGIIAHGPVAITRGVFDVLQWSTDFNLGEDVEFNRKAHSHFRNTIVVCASLYLYRNTLSSHGP